MDYARLGRTAIEVSRVAFGTGSLGELYGPVDEAQALKVVDEAIGYGINFFDKSCYCGSAEECLGKALTASETA